MFELYSWGSEYNLLSFDPFCLSVEAYLIFSGAEWELHECQSKKSTELPILKDGMTEILDVYKIINYLKKKGYNLDETAELNNKQLSEVMAYSSLIEDKLYDALLYTLWLENENYTKKTKPTYIKSMSLIDRYYLPGKFLENIRERLKDIEMVKKNGEIIPEIYLNAHDSYTALSTKLGNKPFFFGDKPTTLDAIAYGHLALHCYPNLQNPKLFSMISFEFPNLIQYCNRISEHYFKSNTINKVPLPKPFYEEITDSTYKFIKSTFDNIKQYSINENAKLLKSKIENINFKKNNIKCINNLETNFKKIKFGSLNSYIQNIKNINIFKRNNEKNENLNYYEKNELQKKQIVNSKVWSVLGAISFFSFYIFHNKIIQIKVDNIPKNNK